MPDGNDPLVPLNINVKRSWKSRIDREVLEGGYAGYTEWMHEAIRDRFNKKTTEEIAREIAVSETISTVIALFADPCVIQRLQQVPSLMDLSEYLRTRKAESREKSGTGLKVLE